MKSKTYLVNCRYSSPRLKFWTNWSRKREKMYIIAHPLVPSASPHSPYFLASWHNAFARPTALELTHHRDHDGNQFELYKLFKGFKDQAGHSTFSSTSSTLRHSSNFSTTFNHVQQSLSKRAVTERPYKFVNKSYHDFLTSLLRSFLCP